MMVKDELSPETHYIKNWYLALCLQPPAKTDTLLELPCLQGGETEAGLKGRSQHLVGGVITDTGGCNATLCDIRKGCFSKHLYFGKHFLKKCSEPKAKGFFTQ